MIKVYPLRYLRPIEQKPQEGNGPPPPSTPPGEGGCKIKVGQLIKNRKTGAIGQVIEVDDQCRAKIRELTYDEIMSIKRSMQPGGGQDINDLKIPDSPNVEPNLEESRLKELLNKIIKGVST